MESIALSGRKAHDNCAQAIFIIHIHNIAKRYILSIIITKQDELPINDAMRNDLTIYNTMQNDLSIDDAMRNDLIINNAMQNDLSIDDAMRAESPISYIAQGIALGLCGMCLQRPVRAKVL